MWLTHDKLSQSWLVVHRCGGHATQWVQFTKAVQSGLENCIWNRPDFLTVNSNLQPFGKGLVTVVVPQLRRGENSLFLWHLDDTRQAVHTFVGHTDVVLEFQWRKPEEGSFCWKNMNWNRATIFGLWTCWSIFFFCFYNELKFKKQVFASVLPAELSKFCWMLWDGNSRVLPCNNIILII